MKKNVIIYLDENKWKNFQRYCAIMGVYPSSIIDKVIDMILKDKKKNIKLYDKLNKENIKNLFGRKNEKK